MFKAALVAGQYLCLWFLGVLCGSKFRQLGMEPQRYSWESYASSGNWAVLPVFSLWSKPWLAKWGGRREKEGSASPHPLPTMLVKVTTWFDPVPQTWWGTRQEPLSTCISRRPGCAGPVQKVESACHEVLGWRRPEPHLENDSLALCSQTDQKAARVDRKGGWDSCSLTHLFTCPFAQQIHVIHHTTGSMSCVYWIKPTPFLPPWGLWFSI